MYNNESGKTVNEGFGVTAERVTELTEIMTREEPNLPTVGDVLNYICNSEGFTDAERAILLFDYGIRLGEARSSQNYKQVLSQLMGMNQPMTNENNNQGVETTEM